LQRIAKQMTERAGLSHPVLLLENRDEPGLLGITYGQEIFVTTEALERLSDDNVAWVIGHEEGHIVRGHCKSNPPSPKPGIADKEEKISFGGLLGSLAIVAVAVGLGVYTYQSIYDSQEEAASTFGKEMARRAGFYPTRFW
jgi:predicted Zn-dependent protease